MCVQTLKQKLGSGFQNEQIVYSLAIHLYNDTVRKFDL